jgi:hypothetical protein
MSGTDMALRGYSLNTAWRSGSHRDALQRSFKLFWSMMKQIGLPLMAGIAGGRRWCASPSAIHLEGVPWRGNAYIRGKKHCIIVVAERRPHTAASPIPYAHQADGFGRLGIWGIRRGGSFRRDRFLATRPVQLPSRSCTRVSGIVVGMVDGQIPAS